jgi:GntR family transcriptional regulator, transcriptional repressor for pyruvate dehydrogenase complex
MVTASARDTGERAEGPSESAIASPSLPRLVTERLVDMIVDGELPPGSILPTERELCEMLGVSRIALREATQVLKALGVLASSPGRGTVILDSAEHAAFEQLSLLLRLSQQAMLDVLEARRILEAAAVRLAAQRATEAELAVLDDSLRRQELLLDEPAAFVEEDGRFHRTIVTAARNRILLQMLDGVARTFWSARRRTTTAPAGRAGALQRHRRLVSALRARDPNRAEGMLLEHLDAVAADIAANHQREVAGSGRRSR